MEFNRNVRYIQWEPDDFITANVITKNIKGINDSPFSDSLPCPPSPFSFSFTKPGVEPSAT